MKWLGLLLPLLLSLPAAADEIETHVSVPVGVDCGLYTTEGCAGRVGLAFHTRRRFAIGPLLEVAHIAYRDEKISRDPNANVQEIVPLVAGAWGWLPLAKGETAPRLHVQLGAGWASDRWSYYGGHTSVSGWLWQASVGVTFRVFFVGARYYRFYLPPASLPSPLNPNVGVLRANPSGLQLNLGFVFDFDTRRRR